MADPTSYAPDTLREDLTATVAGTKIDRDKSPEDAEKERKKVEHWNKEMDLSERFFKDFLSDSVDAVHAYISEQSDSTPRRSVYKLNLFWSNVNTLTAIMYAKLPKVEADRRFADPSDDVARVASEIVTRLLQNDMNDPDDKLDTVLKQALQDRLVAGLGTARVRYCMQEEGEGEEAVKKDEWCDMEYVHWRDIRWSPCRTPAEVRWKAFRTYMTKSECIARFGEDIATHVPYSTRGAKLDPSDGDSNSAMGESSDSGQGAQAEIWEIWDKTSRCVYWYVKGFPRFLDKKEDPMELDGFFPDAPPMVANASTLKYIPKADWQLTRDLYNEIDELEARIALLTKACKATGVYPASAGEIQRILTEAVENQLVPVENWAMFADKGGLKGQIDYFPVEAIANTITILSVQQQARIQQLYQVTGMSDIIRGQASTQGVTATEQKIKAQFASTRMQALQEEFARFTGELLNRKLQLVRKLYEPERIKELSNIMQTPDAQFADQAIALIKNPEQFDCRVVVRADTMAQIDYESLKAERGEFMVAVSSFLGSASPMLKEMPAAAPFLLELLKFQLAGMKGANEMEGVIDQAISALIEAEKAKAEAPPEPSPEEKAEQIKVQGAIQIEQAKAQAGAAADQQNAQLEAQKMQQEMQMKQAEMQAEIQRDREKHQLEMAKLQMEIQFMQAKMGLEREKMEFELEAKQAEQAITMQGQVMEQEFRAEEAEQEQEFRAESADQDMAISERQARAKEKQMSRQAAIKPQGNPRGQ